MKTLIIIGAIVVFLGVLGPFLDKHHLDESTIDKIRLRLVACYVFLYDLPKRSGPIVRWLDSLHEKRAFDIRTGEYVKEHSTWRGWIIPLFQVAFAIAFPIINQVYFNGPSWLLSIGGGLVLAWMAPLLLILIVGLWAILASLCSLIVLAILEAIRRFLLIVFNKSTNPRTSPFTYLAALISVFSAGGAAVHQVVEQWDWNKPAFIVWIEDSIASRTAGVGLTPGDRIRPQTPDPKPSWPGRI